MEYQENELNKIYSSVGKKINISFADKNSIPKVSLKLLEGSKNLGYKCLEIPRWIKKIDGKLVKQSMTETYLKDYDQIRGEFITDCEVVKIIKSSLKMK